MQFTLPCQSLLLALPALTLAAIPSMSGTGYTKTLFADDFNGAKGASPQASKWIIDTGTGYAGGQSQWGTGEIETMSSSAANVALHGNSQLWITPIRAADGSWTSGRIETVKRNFVAPAAGKMRIEARIRMPAITTENGLGYWPAFWTLGGAFRGNYSNWPDIGEFDIMENVNALTGINAGLHCGVDPDGPCDEPDGLGQRTSCPDTSCNGNWHVYTLVHDRTTSPETLNYYIDEELSYTISESTVGTAAWKDAVDDGHFVLLDLAIGGSYPDGASGMTTPTSATVSGKEMRIDYVFVWAT